MSANTITAFLDTNIVVYAHDGRDPIKHAIAVNLLGDGLLHESTCINQQVIQEFCNVALKSRTLQISPDKLKRIVRDGLLPLLRPLEITYLFDRALELYDRYSLSWYDCLIVQAAIDFGCTTLYSENLQAGQQFGSLQVVNPFDEQVTAGYLR